MQILVVVGYCLRVNSSANLCHLSYIRGLLELGHQVDLLTVSEEGQRVDNSIRIPKEVNLYEYPSSLYEVLSYKKNQNNRKDIQPLQADSIDSINKKQSFIRRVITTGKTLIRESYGIHGTVNAWYKKALKFYSDKEYDYVISLAHPPISHVLVYDLKRKGRIKYKKWIQVWEDPWVGDFDTDRRTQKVYEEEKRILGFAEKICYVSPLTLHYQQEMYPESADKMYWQPLPSYYRSNETDSSFTGNVYGYFGDYNPLIRNLIPFYEAAIETEITCNICGNPTGIISSKNKTSVYPRLPLKELAVIEDKTNVLIFLCNKQGGQIPGKIYQYSATNKIILFILDGTPEEKEVLKNYFEPFNRYMFCENTVEDITRAIKLIEAGNCGTIENKPIEAFNPKETIRKILEEGK